VIFEEDKMAELLPYIFNAIVIAGLMYMAWRDGFEQGQSTANRKHTKWWSDLRGRCIRIAEQVHGLDNRVDGIEARLAKLEQPDVTVLYANNEPYATVPDVKPKDATFDGYKLRCEPELDDICKSCTRQGTSICYGCGFDHVFYDRNEEKPEDWSCDTCVNDGDMSHLQCRYCNEGSCYVKKEEPLKFDYEPSGEVVGTVTEIKDTEGGIRVKIKKEDQDANTDSN
jgi:hypothetical protein